MVIALFGESCTGKSTVAGELSKRLGARVYTGKDYLKLAKSESEASKAFAEILKSSQGNSEVILYVISEKEHMALLPEKAFRILVTAELGVIKERFAKRMNGNLPAPVANMLEKKHGLFDTEKHDLHIRNAGEGETISGICDRIIQTCGL